MANSAVCKVANCSNAAIKRGYCNAHYLRQWRHGDPGHGNALFGDQHKYIESLLLAAATSECVLWPFGTSVGYGMMRVNGKPIRAHRYVCILRHGPPTGKRYQAAHQCGNKLCVNPKHLRWATAVENRRDYELHVLEQVTT